MIENPTDETWNDACGIILNMDAGLGRTLWQAVIAVDPTFPKIGPRSPQNSKREPWPRVPTREVLVAALRYATH